ncbi:MAG: hypothetical protein H6746_13235 [Deltaproteobacteria bacterium]|nr:hypothetical protein [Deltaproteobacteria bacterium]
MRGPAHATARWEIGRTWDGEDLPEAERATVSAWLEGDALHVEVDAPYAGDPAPPGPPGSTPALWEHEVVELFLLGEGARYTELELGPHGHHLVLQLAGRRQVVAQGLPLRYEARIVGDRFTGRARLDAALLPPGPHRANACAIRGLGARRRFMSAWPLPGDGPDFHRLECFRPTTLGDPGGR